MIRRAAALALAGGALCCGAPPRVRVALPYPPRQPARAVAVAVSNETGRELPMPPPDVLARAIAAITGAGGRRCSVADAFEAALRSELARKAISVVAADPAKPLLRLRLGGWDPYLDGAGASIVRVTADYELRTGEGTALWRVEERRLPVRVHGPNLNRAEVRRIAHEAVERALASLPAPPPGPLRDLPLRDGAAPSPGSAEIGPPRTRGTAQDAGALPRSSGAAPRRGDDGRHLTP